MLSLVVHETRMKELKYGKKNEKFTSDKQFFREITEFIVKFAIEFLSARLGNFS